MSGYSYAMSLIRKEDFREPKLLAKLFRRSTLEGWLLHYAVGLFFSGVYAAIWKNKKISPMKSSLVFGALSGVIAIAVWKATFKLHPGQPLTDHAEFYLQLFVAHLVFCTTTAAAYESR
jgi:hypothetical protein